MDMQGRTGGGPRRGEKMRGVLPRYVMLETSKELDHKIPALLRFAINRISCTESMIIWICLLSVAQVKKL